MYYHRKVLIFYRGNVRIGIMKTGKSICPVLLFLFLAPLARGQSFFPTELELDSFEQSYRNVDIENLDVSELLREAGTGQHCLSGEDASQLIELNVSYIIFHKLNRDRLFIVPDGQYIVNKASEIYGSLNRIDDLIRQGRALSGKEIRNDDTRGILDDLKKNARDLRKNFRQYFVELSEAEYEFEISTEGGPVQFMSDYLDECEKVNVRLRSTLDRFFFHPSPGVVTVEDYRSYSVALLSRSLEVLSDSFAERLQ